MLTAARGTRLLSNRGWFQRFSEDVEPTFAETPSNFTVSGGQSVVGAELLGSDVLRLTLSAPLGLGETIGTTAIPDAAGITSGAISIAPTQ